ncbi:YbjN domain-containing protein [Prochlorothrix hollandica]|uniref:YbjN domain-containing protein n=1 Tax=Prochlorothrix hollandica PCC 9006 = CALU 1027 TaxID=317619 RepID=A0A0M2PYM0_PROHO|nr:YbjN domain-containing protein [Prochlorothrix hollandica]KKJ01260.1 hypothetical protein PROH_02525 [Prochlorothrix hollandica PCC 9006 = CALU 1027]
MAVTLDQLAQLLDQRNWHYQQDPESQCIYTGVKAQNLDKLFIVLNLTENGEFLQLQAPQILSLTDHVYKGPTLQTLATIQYQVKMLRLEYDPSDGEIRGSIELPLEDASLTQRQFDRALNGLIQLVDHHAIPRLRQTLATGIDPGPPSLAQQMLHALPQDFISALAQAIQQFPQAS